MNQTYKDFNVLIVDDNSSDNTKTIIRNWEKADGRIKLVRINNNNEGLTKNLNYLLNYSNSEYIARMDADDICEPNRLEEQVRYLNEHPDVSVVGTIAYQIDENDEKKEALRRVPIDYDSIKKMIHIANPMIHPSVMFRREDILSIGGYNENYRTAQDYELWFRCLANNMKLANINKPLIQYRISSQHANKRNLKYRLLDARLRWNGTRMLSFPFHQRMIAASIPIVLGLMPNWLKNLAIRHSNKLDPRQKINL